MLIALYILFAVICSTTTAVIDGYREEDWSDYHPGHFFLPILIGAVWPLTLPTVGAYQLGINLKKRSRLKAEQRRLLAEEKRKKEREIERHMPDVDRLLGRTTLPK